MIVRRSRYQRSMFGNNDSTRTMFLRDIHLHGLG